MSYILKNGLLLGILSMQLISIECMSDIAVLGGNASVPILSSDAPTYPLAGVYNLYGTETSEIQIPIREEGQINCVAVNQYDGAIFYGGISTYSNRPLIYKGSVVSSELLVIEVPGTELAAIFCSAISADGTVLFGGVNAYSYPVIYRLAPGALEVSFILFPNSNRGLIRNIAIDSNGRAILVGIDENNKPLIYSLEKTESEVVLIPPPNTDDGVINCIAIGSDGTAILGGTNLTTNSALLYSILFNSFFASLISIPNSEDYSVINDVAIGSDGSAILVGSRSDLSTIPLVYRVDSGESFATTIINPNSGGGFLNSVAIGSDGTAIMGGGGAAAPDYADLPLIYRLINLDTTASSLELPNFESGEIASVAIGSQNIAILGGLYYTFDQTLLFQVKANESVSSLVYMPTEGLENYIDSIEMYSTSNALYDIRRIRPYYGFEQSEATLILNQ